MTTPKIDLSGLFPYCKSESQALTLQAVIDAGSNNKAAKALGKSRRSVDKTIARIKESAAKQHFSPENQINNPLPDGMISAGVSQLIDERTGQPMLTWYKSKPEKDLTIESLIRTLEDFSPKPLPKIKQPKEKLNSDLANLLTITDYHIGSYCWSKQTGDNWDIDIAEQTFINAITDMINCSPNAETAILNIQGDFLHWDSVNTSVTPTSQHVLDSDSRGGKMIDLALDLTIWACELLLKHHKNVHLIVCEGNHDETGSMWLGKAMARVFKNNSRLTVDNSEFPFYTYLHGKTLMCFHHGHKVKNQDLQSVFSSEPRFREAWGKARYAHIHTGHYHHKEKHIDEFSGCVVERHPSLTGRDNYATRLGLYSERGAHIITYHKEKGEVSRQTVYPEIKGVV